MSDSPIVVALFNRIGSGFVSILMDGVSLVVRGSCSDYQQTSCQSMYLARQDFLLLAVLSGGIVPQIEAGSSLKNQSILPASSFESQPGKAPAPSGSGRLSLDLNLKTGSDRG